MAHRSIDDGFITGAAELARPLRHRQAGVDRGMGDARGEFFALELRERPLELAESSSDYVPFHVVNHPGGYLSSKSGMWIRLPDGGIVVGCGSTGADSPSGYGTAIRFGPGSGARRWRAIELEPSETAVNNSPAHCLPRAPPTDRSRLPREQTGDSARARELRP